MPVSPLYRRPPVRVAVLCAAAALAAAAGVRLAGVASGLRGPLPPVAAVLVTETGNALMPVEAAEPLPFPRARWEGGARGRFELPAGTVPRGPRPLVVIHRLEHLDLLLFEQAYASPRGRVVLDLRRPVRVPGLAVRGGRPQPVADLVDDRGRLIGAPLVVERPDGGSAVRVRLAGAVATLQPGTGWGEAMVGAANGGRLRIREGPGWAEALQAALASAQPVTVLRVAHLGLWPRDRFRAAGEPR